MFAQVMIVALAMMQSPPSHTAPSANSPTPGITAEHIYNGVNRPARVTVTAPRSFGTITLALMDYDGTPLAEPIAVHPGVVDLAETVPSIWDVRRTAYLQLIDGQTPIGSALVLQPMLSRMVPLTEVRPHPTHGRPHTRIIGWMDENEPRMQDPPSTKVQSPNAPLAPGSAGGDTVDGAPEEDTASTNNNEALPVERLFSGLRMYPERDVVLRTNLGDIRLAMKPDEAPNTAWNFLELCRGGFYRDVPFHRVVPLTAAGQPFVIQAGDPCTPAMGDGGPGYWLPIENSQLPHDFGVISMARSDDPDSNGSQFFIALSREGTARLDGQYCSFGYAVDGAQTILMIAQVPLADVAAGRPVDPPMIRNAELVPAPPRTPGIGRPDARVTPESKPAEPLPTGRIPR
jgi:peptidyl-prolyl cis-trans isomerase B (cyclophilin B)